MQQIHLLYMNSPPPLNPSEHSCHMSRFPRLFLVLATKKRFLNFPVPLSLVSLFLYLKALSPFQLIPNRTRENRLDILETKHFCIFFSVVKCKGNLIVFSVSFRFIFISKFWRVILDTVRFSGFLASICSLQNLYGRWKFSKTSGYEMQQPEQLQDDNGKKDQNYFLSECLLDRKKKCLVLKNNEEKTLIVSCSSHLHHKVEKLEIC